MNPYLEYLRYVVRHKRFVYQEGRKLGVSRSQLLLHDLHKLLPDEFIPYALFFNTDRGDEAAFNLAWLRHQRRSLHHWQAWVLLEDTGAVKTLPMPERYRREMLADWRGAGRAITGKDDTKGWYQKSAAFMILHADTRAWIEAQVYGPAEHIKKETA